MDGAIYDLWMYACPKAHFSLVILTRQGVPDFSYETQALLLPCSIDYIRWFRPVSWVMVVVAAVVFLDAAGWRLEMVGMEGVLTL